MKPDFQNLVREVRSGKIRPVYFLYGEESFFIDSLVRELREKIVRPETRDFNYDMLHAEETDGDAVIAIASSFPLMSERRLIVVKSVQKFPPSDKKRILAYVEAPLESTCLVLTAPDADKRQSFYGELSKLAASVECKPLYPEGAAEWVERAVAARGGKISKEAAGLLVEQVGVQLLTLSCEIEKLMTFAGPKTTLGLAEVEAAAGFSRKYNQWDFSDAVGNREFSLAVVIMGRLLQEKSSETGLIVELSRRVVLLMKVRALMDTGGSKSQINAAIKVNPYFVDRYIEQARNYTIQELRMANRSLLGADVLIKTGALDPRTAITLAVYDMIRGAKKKRYYIENAA